MAASPYVVTVTRDNFQTLVVEGSRQRPVLVDYWADWCAPCRALAPILERVAEAYGGKLLVAKLDTEAERELAAHQGIRSLPTVRLFRDGRPVDEFVGALPEAQVRAFLEPHLPRDSDRLLDQADARLGRGDLAGAEDLLEQARRDDPANPRGGVLWAQIQVARGDFAAAEQTLAELTPDQQDLPEVQALRGRLAFDQVVAEAPAPAELERRLAADPQDSEARYQLAAHRVVAGDFPAALDLLLDLLRRDRKYGEDAARKAMLRIFDLLGGRGELVSRYRTRMLSTLF